MRCEINNDYIVRNVDGIEHTIYDKEENHCFIYRFVGNNLLAFNLVLTFLTVFALFSDWLNNYQ